MQYKDGRFAKDPRFRFFAMNTILRHKMISTTNVFVKRTGFNFPNVSALKNAIDNDKTILNNLMAYI